MVTERESAQRKELQGSFICLSVADRSLSTSRLDKIAVLERACADSEKEKKIAARKSQSLIKDLQKQLATLAKQVSSKGLLAEEQLSTFTV